MLHYNRIDISVGDYIKLIDKIIMRVYDAYVLDNLKIVNLIYMMYNESLDVNK